MTGVPDAPTEYAHRVQARRERAADLAASERRIGSWRLVVFGVGVVVAAAVFGAGALAPLWVLVPLIAFALLVLAHTRVIPARRRADRAVHYYERGLARLEDRWA